MTKKVVLRLNPDEVRLILKTLNQAASAYSVFEDDSDEGYWRPKLQLESLSYKIGESFKKSMK
jgi:hypothetical protein